MRVAASPRDPSVPHLANRPPYGSLTAASHPCSTNLRHPASSHQHRHAGHLASLCCLPGEGKGNVLPHFSLLMDLFSYRDALQEQWFGKKEVCFPLSPSWKGEWVLCLSKKPRASYPVHKYVLDLTRYCMLSSPTEFNAGFPACEKRGPRWENNLTDACKGLRVSSRSESLCLHRQRETIRGRNCIQTKPRNYLQ